LRIFIFYSGRSFIGAIPITSLELIKVGMPKDGLMHSWYVLPLSHNTYEVIVLQIHDDDENVFP
jgi:hypothetical protein